MLVWSVRRSARVSAGVSVGLGFAYRGWVRFLVLASASLVLNGLSGSGLPDRPWFRGWVYGAALPAYVVEFLWLSRHSKSYALLR